MIGSCCHLKNHGKDKDTSLYKRGHEDPYLHEDIYGYLGGTLLTAHPFSQESYKLKR